MPTRLADLLTAFFSHPIVGLCIGSLLRVFVPYFRSGLEQVAEEGNFDHWPGFDWRYLALVLLPLLEYGVVFLTVDGLWSTALTWGTIYAIQLGWSGSDIGKEVIQVGAALVNVTRSRNQKK